MNLKKLKKIVQKELDFKGNHVPYTLYSPRFIIKNCKNEYLKTEFAEWNETPGFLTALFNLCIRMPKNTTIEELKNHLRNIEKKYLFDVSYFDPNDKYVAEKIRNGGVWNECLISIDRAKGDEDANKYVSLSKLKEYLMDMPNLHCCSGSCWNIDRKTMKKLVRDGLVYKPNRDEKFLF